MYAVVTTGNKQYKVAQDDIIKVENVVFDHDNGKVKITYAPAI